jgi:predicted Zn-dependent protease
MNSYEELVALLGHEISHVQNQHSLKSICRAAASGIVLSAFIGDASGMSSSLFSQINQFKQLDYSRELETEADQKGLDFMISNKADPKGMLNLLFLLKKESHEEPGMMKYLSTHPDTDSRIHAIIANRDSKKSFGSDESMQALFIKIKSACKAE